MKRRLMMTDIIVLVLSLILFLSAHVLASEIDHFMEEGKKAYSAGQLKEALARWEAGLELAREAGDKKYLGTLITSIGIVYSDLGQYAKALEYLGQALAIRTEIGDRGGEGKVFGNIGNVYSNLGRYEKALEYLGQALAIHREMGDRSEEGADLSNIGIVNSELGRNEKALEYLEQALAIMREVGDRSGEGADLGNIGIVYSDLGQYGKALEYYEQALAIQKEIGELRSEAIDLNNIANVYLYLGHYEKALESYGQALAMMREIGDRGGQGKVLDNIGNVYLYLEYHVKALQFLDMALVIEREIGDRSGEAKSLDHTGSVYSELGKSGKALEYYEKALAICREIGNRGGEGAELINMGLVYRDLGRYEKVREVLKASLVIYNETGALDGLWKTKRGLGEVEARLEAYTEAISHYDQAIDTLESMRAGITEKEEKTSFMEDKLHVYDDFIELLLTLNPKDPSKGYDKKALEIFERKQGRTFLEEIGKSAATNFSGLPEEVRAKESGLSVEHTKAMSALVDERSKPASSRSSERIQGLEERLRRIKADQENLQKEIKARYPDYYALKYPQPATLSELQKTVLEPGELMLVYGVKKESTCLWVIGKEQFGFFTISAGEKGIEEKVAEFRNVTLAVLKAIEREDPRNIKRIAQMSIKQLEHSGREIYDLLVPEGAKEMVAKAGTLYIIPTGALYTLPFEALASGNPDAQGPRYLVQDHSVAYLSSASLLKTLREAAARKKEKALYPLLAFANPVYSQALRDASSQAPLSSSDETAGTRGVSLVPSMRTRAYLDIMGGYFPELPDTEDEAREIKTILEAPDESRPLQLREAASRSNVFTLNDEDKLKDYRFLLFSCHGIAPDKVDPLVQPALVLSLPDPKTGKKEYLTMADAFGLKLNAELVSLSACNTGRGKVQKGEGVIGLTRAFMYAGTQAVSVTLWSVESGSAKTLGTGLFRNLEEGKGRAEALRNIKLSMLRGEEGDLYRHPFFWAPVVLFGDGK